MGKYNVSDARSPHEILQWHFRLTSASDIIHITPEETQGREEEEGACNGCFIGDHCILDSLICDAYCSGRHGAQYGSGVGRWPKMPRGTGSKFVLRGGGGRGNTCTLAYTGRTGLLTNRCQCTMGSGYHDTGKTVMIIKQHWTLGMPLVKKNR